MRLPLLAGVVLATFPATTLAQVEPCRDKMPAITDGRLQATVDALRAKFPDPEFQADDACGRAKATRRALTATLRRNLLRAASRSSSWSSKHFSRRRRPRPRIDGQFRTGFPQVSDICRADSQCCTGVCNVAVSWLTPPP